MGIFNLIKRAILFLSVPLQKWLQRRGRLETQITKKIVDRLMAMIKPGDILGSREMQRWTSPFIKGFFEHAAIVALVDGVLQVVEAVGDLWIHIEGKLTNVGGVRLVPLEEWLYKKDYIFVTRTNLPQGIIDQAWNHALTLIGRGYDYWFRLGEETIYCSELVLLCYRKFWSPFMRELADDVECLPQMFWDFAQHNICSYLIGVINTKLEEEKFTPLSTSS